MSDADAETMRLFGVQYWQPGERGIYRATPGRDAYYYEAYVGEHLGIEIEGGDSLVLLAEGRVRVDWLRGFGQRGDCRRANSRHFAVKFRGFMPDERTRELTDYRPLPYVNGCATKQLFPPDRLGDPTLQYLDIPPHSAEQAHHIHSTPRVVYILRGRGISDVGMEGRSVRTELVEGMVCLLEAMCPHHFETPQGEHLVCMPVHVFSSAGAAEFNHPMFNGTHLMNQGG